MPQPGRHWLQDLGLDNELAAASADRRPDRVVALARVVRLLGDVANEDEVVRWLRTSRNDLAGPTPAEAIATGHAAYVHAAALEYVNSTILITRCLREAGMSALDIHIWWTSPAEWPDDRAPVDVFEEGDLGRVRQAALRLVDPHGSRGST